MRKEEDGMDTRKKIERNDGRRCRENGSRFREKCSVED